MSHIYTPTRLWRNREGGRLSTWSSGLGGSPCRDRQGPSASSSSSSNSRGGGGSGGGGSGGRRTPLPQPLLDPQLFIPKLSFGAYVLLEVLRDKATHKTDGRVSISGGITEIQNSSSTNVTQFQMSISTPPPQKRTERNHVWFLFSVSGPVSV